MRIFKKPNISGGFICPICGSSEEKEVVLIGIQGTENNGNMEARQYHLDCIDLTEMKLEKDTVIFHRFNRECGRTL